MTHRILVFLCNGETRQEVFDKNLVGTTLDVWATEFSGIRVGDVFLLYDYSDNANSAFGPLRVKAIGSPLERGVWRGRFPAQARFDSSGEWLSRLLSLLRRG